MDIYRVDKLMAEARRLAAEYRRATGKTLAISGEIAVSDAINLLGLEPAPADADGYDVLRPATSCNEPRRLQVKARVVFDDSRRPHRLGQLKVDKEWDGVLLVLMDENYEAMEMYETDRAAVVDALEEATPNRRGTLSVARFRNIARLVWTREEGRVSHG
ncbi:MAG: hypothetical protein AB7Q81_17155 [Gammaproteobacteria bacterium]